MILRTGLALLSVSDTEDRTIVLRTGLVLLSVSDTEDRTRAVVC